MIELIDKTQCCSCTACVAICPQNCITMRADHEGFKYPEIEKSKCIGCNLCNNVCPVINNDICYINDFSLRAFVLRDKREDILSDSTSGGFFTALAEKIISEGGTVYGAAYDNKFNVRHIRIREISEIKRIRGSKYVASNLDGIFKLVKEDLQKRDTVLFTGCPCQIAGLKSFLKSDYKNLVTMDVVCHGNPSPLMWSKYLGYITSKYKSTIKDIVMRHKTYGYHSGTMMIEFESGKKIYESARTNYYLKAFFGDLISKPHCYKCSFKHKEHCSDFTVFDAWHAAELASIQDDDKGWTNIIIQSKKGLSIFETICEKYEYFETDHQKAIELDGDMLEVSVNLNEKRNEFLKELKSSNFKHHCENYINVSFIDRMIEALKKYYYWRK